MLMSKRLNDSGCFRGIEPLNSRERVCYIPRLKDVGFAPLSNSPSAIIAIYLDMTPDMPKPSKIEYTVRVSQGDAENLARLAEKRGLAFAEVLSDAVKLGTPLLIEAQNKADIFKRVSAKAKIIDALDGLPQAKYDEAIALLKALGEAEK
jgi:hypothetical protein